MIFLLLFFPTIEGRNEESKRSIFTRSENCEGIFFFFLDPSLSAIEKDGILEADALSFLLRGEMGEMAVEGRFSIFLHYLFIAPREKYHTLVVRDSNGANWHAAPFFATLFFFSTLVPRTSKEFEPCTYPSFIRFRVATAEQGSSPSSPPRFILYRSMDGVSLSFMDDGFFRRIDEKNFRRGGEMTTLIVRISLEIGATKLIHEVDERHNFEKTISSSRQLSRAFSFSFFVFNFTFGNRASKLADYFIVRHIAVPE